MTQRAWEIFIGLFAGIAGALLVWVAIRAVWLAASGE